MKHFILIISLALIFIIRTNGQVAINTNGADPDSTAILDISSSDKGLLIPRMSADDRNAILNPATGLMVFDTSTNNFYYYSGNWNKITPSSFEFPDSDGDSLKVLATDGNGNLNWTNNEDAQTLSFTGDSISILNGNTIDMAPLKNVDSSGLKYYITGSPAASIIQEEYNSNKFYGSSNFWQSFTPTISGIFDQLDIYISNGFSTGTIKIFSGEGTSGELLLEINDYDLNNNWNSVDLSSYDIVFEKDSLYTYRVNHDGGFNYQLSEGNPYDGGRAGKCVNCDMPFRVYITPIYSEKIISIQQNSDLINISINAIDTIHFSDGSYQSTAFPDPEGLINQYLNVTNSGEVAWTDKPADSDNQKVDKFSFYGNTLSLSLEDDGESDYTVNLSTLNNTDDQVIDQFSLSGSTLSLSIENDGETTKTVDLSPVNTDNQTIDKFELSGNILKISLENDGLADLSVDLTPLIDDLVPIGTIHMWPTSSPPSGWFLCNGSTFNASTYSELNSILGGNTLPDFTGRFPLGSGNSGTSGATSHSLGSEGGEETHTLTISEMPSHSHEISYSGKSKSGSGGEVSDLENASKTVNTSASGGGQAHNNMPPFYTVNFIIKAQ